MTSTGNNGPQDGSQSRSQAKASRRAQLHQEMLRQQAAARRKAQLKTAGMVAVVVLVIAAIVIAVVLNTRGDDEAAPSGPATGDVIGAVTSVSTSTIDAVGKGTSQTAPKAITDQPAMTADGKPRVLYAGGEFCPFCAAERWSVVNALSRFGTFTNLGQTSSTGNDVYPNTATLSFHGASYTSDYLSFTGVELTDRDQQPLDSLSAADQKIFDAQNPDGGIPFIAYGGRFTASGAGYDPQVLQGKTHAEIADALKDPDNDITQAIVGQANVITATLCQLTDQKPAAVCNAAGVKAAA